MSSSGTQPSRPAPRLAKILPDQMTDEQRVLYDSIANGPRSKGPQLFSLTDPEGGLEGPFNAMLLNPGLGEALQALGSAVRFASSLSRRSRELATLTVAREWDNSFEIYAHEAIGRFIGLSDEELTAVRDGQFSALTDDTERMIVETVKALASRSDLTDEEYATACEGLGVEVVFELSTIVGYYATLALQLRLYRVTAPN